MAGHHLAEILRRLLEDRGRYLHRLVFCLGAVATLLEGRVVHRRVVFDGGT